MQRAAVAIVNTDLVKVLEFERQILLQVDEGLLQRIGAGHGAANARCRSLPTRNRKGKATPGPMAQQEGERRARGRGSCRAERSAALTRHSLTSSSVPVRKSSINSERRTSSRPEERSWPMGEAGWRVLGLHFLDGIKYPLVTAIGTGQSFAVACCGASSDSATRDSGHCTPHSSYLGGVHGRRLSPESWQPHLTRAHDIVLASPPRPHWGPTAHNRGQLRSWFVTPHGARVEGPSHGGDDPWLHAASPSVLPRRHRCDCHRPAVGVRFVCDGHYSRASAVRCRCAEWGGDAECVPALGRAPPQRAECTGGDVARHRSGAHSACAVCGTPRAPLRGACFRRRGSHPAARRPERRFPCSGGLCGRGCCLLLPAGGGRMRRAAAGEPTARTDSRRRRHRRASRRRR